MGPGLLAAVGLGSAAIYNIATNPERIAAFGSRSSNNNASSNSETNRAVISQLSRP